MKVTPIWQIIAVLAVVAISVFCYDYYYRKPARDEAARTFTVNRINHNDEISYEPYA